MPKTATVDAGTSTKTGGLPLLEELTGEGLKLFFRNRILAGQTLTVVAEETGVDQKVLSKRAADHGISFREIKRQERQRVCGRLDAKFQEIFQLHKVSVRLDEYVVTWGDKEPGIDTALAERVFIEALHGKSSTQITEAVDGVQKHVVDLLKLMKPELDLERRAMAQTIMRYMRTPLLTDQEKDVFRMLAIDGLTLEQAGRKLKVGPKRIGIISRQLTKDIPSLKILLGRGNESI